MKITANIHKEILNDQTNQFAKFFRAYMECTDSVKSIIADMVEIITDDEAEADEKDHAVMVLLEALFPAFCEDIRENELMMNTCDDGKEAIAALDKEEASFAENLKRLMKERNVTQEHLASLTNVSQSAISNIINRNSRPQRRTIKRFATALDVEPKDLWPEMED